MAVIGFVLLLAGVGIGTWAGATLGWRRAIALDAGPPHPALPVLIFAGPYQFVRHPRALAIILTSVGAALMREFVPVWACVATATGALIAAAWRERRLVELGEAYARYRKTVSFLLPRRPRPV